MELWWNDEKMYFLDQDEDLYIAEMDNLYLILHYLDRQKVSAAKQIVLVNALCVLLYDHIANKEEQSEKDRIIRKKNLEILLPKIAARKKLILQHKEQIYDYIFEIVEPYIQ